MDFTGEYLVPAPIDRVWEGINDPEILKQCIDGCEELVKSSDTEFAGKVKVKVGPVSAKFAGTVTMEEMTPPTSCTMAVKGQGGMAGFAKGSAKVTLTEEGAGTKLVYEAKAEVGGKLASVGARLVRGVADKTAADFFAKFSAIVGAGTPEPTSTETVTEQVAPPPPPPPIEPVASVEEVPFTPVPVSVAGPSEARDELPITGSSVVIVAIWGTIAGLIALGVLYSLFM
ncbi:MAG: carbon monoxide dehydrogenase subunit G [Rhodospirillum sp.]|nr:carbon monoxide dehydrogenase subunit G [Rhodospirillum sp.]MCF8488438.1 carbon monoxide dehydrogenase subunit G [Rhodospirillum sp.]MCF8499100.1 carbon monoxide dehydrogenase subunit G [Rhodospirillum sp.]